jgi:hypothetical protein
MAVARQVGLESKDALVSMLTVETLLFAAFAVAAAFMPKTRAGWDLMCSAGVFAWLVAAAIVVTAIGAAAAWADVYLRCGLSTAQYVAAAALAVGIVAVAAMSVWVAEAVRRNTDQ